MKGPNYNFLYLYNTIQPTRRRRLEIEKEKEGNGANNWPFKLQLLYRTPLKMKSFQFWREKRGHPGKLQDINCKWKTFRVKEFSKVFFFFCNKKGYETKQLLLLFSTWTKQQGRQMYPKIYCPWYYPRKNFFCFEMKT